MPVAEQYDQWSETYDTVDNLTRDLEKHACEDVLSRIRFRTVLEIGGGTGKNTAMLAARAGRVLSIDVSEKMQAVARSKVAGANVEFRIADIQHEWDFVREPFDLITCSLILEHVADLAPVFRRAHASLVPGGSFYVCELHPFKQYAGGKARFETAEGMQNVDCYRHHVTDYSNAAIAAGFAIAEMDEWFDDGDRDGTPRLISFLFRRER